VKPHQLATLVLRLLGIYCLIVFLPVASLFSSVIPYARYANDNSGIAAIIFAALLLIFWLGAGILLIVCSVPWGKGLTPKDVGEGNITAISFEQVQMLAFAIAGVLIFSDALPQLLNSFFSLLTSIGQIANKNQPPAYAEYNWRLILTAIGTVLKSALGLCLFFGASGFVSFWRSMRNFGTPKPSQM